MSKTKRKYNREEDYGNDELPQKNENQRIREKRFKNALKQKNIDEILALEESEEDNEEEPQETYWHRYYGEDEA